MPDLSIVRERVNSVVGVLNNFKALREEVYTHMVASLCRVPLFSCDCFVAVAAIMYLVTQDED